MFQLSKLKRKLFASKPTLPKRSAPLPNVTVPEAIVPYYGSRVAARVVVDDQSVVIKSAFLSDGPEVVQVIFREDTLMDIDALNSALARHYHRMPRGDYHALLREAQLNLIPPIPDLLHNRAQIVVDKALDDLDWGVIDLTGKRDFVFVTKEQLAAWLNGYDRYEVTMPIHEVNPHCGNLEEDGDAINSSIRRLSTLRIKKRLADTLELPPLPKAAKEIVELRSNPLANLNDLVRVIESDPTMAANVLRWANSSMYGRGGKVDTLHEAIGRVLGYDMVMNLSMGLVLGKMMAIPQHQTSHLLTYWEQALWVAHGTAAVADLVPSDRGVKRGVAYLTGLFHNFGYLILSYTFPPHFRTVTESTDINRHLDASIVDLHILGITREQVASELMRNWNMPEELIYGIRYQKLPDYVGEHCPYANLVFLARNLLIERGLGLGAPAIIPESTFRILGIDPVVARQRIDKLLDEQARIDGMARLLG